MRIAIIGGGIFGITSSIILAKNHQVELFEKNNELYVDSEWYQFFTDDGLPASNPPWGYIAKLDLVSGKNLV